MPLMPDMPDMPDMPPIPPALPLASPFPRPFPFAEAPPAPALPAPPPPSLPMSAERSGEAPPAASPLPSLPMSAERSWGAGMATAAARPLRWGVSMPLRWARKGWLCVSGGVERPCQACGSGEVTYARARNAMRTILIVCDGR